MGMMDVRAGFVRAWLAWQRTTLPVSDFRNRRGGSPRHDIELLLDHIASYVYSILSAAMEGRRGFRRDDPP